MIFQNTCTCINKVYICWRCGRGVIQQIYKSLFGHSFGHYHLILCKEGQRISPLAELEPMTAWSRDGLSDNHLANMQADASLKMAENSLHSNATSDWIISKFCDSKFCDLLDVITLFIGYVASSTCFWCKIAEFQKKKKKKKWEKVH